MESEKVKYFRKKWILTSLRRMEQRKTRKVKMKDKDAALKPKFVWGTFLELLKFPSLDKGNKSIPNTG